MCCLRDCAKGVADNNLLSLDLTKTWNRATPSLTGLTQPSGPPAVALGTLWHSYTSLFLYGGEFAELVREFLYILFTCRNSSTFY